MEALGGVLRAAQPWSLDQQHGHTACLFPEIIRILKPLKLQRPELRLLTRQSSRGRTESPPGGCGTGPQPLAASL